MACLLNGTQCCFSSYTILRLTLQLYGQQDVHFVTYKVTRVFCNYPVYSVVGVSMANCSCGKQRLLTLILLMWRIG
jgi:hypothetical protein